MSFMPRHTVVALAAAFIIGTVGGGLLLAGGGGATSGTGVPFDPDSNVADESSASPTPKAKAAGDFTADADPQGGRIVISGDGAEPGAKLVVQRKESSGWQDFPAHATAAKDGRYSTYIITSRDGTYRVKDTDSDAASESVKVTAPAQAKVTKTNDKTDDQAKDKTKDPAKA